MAGSRFNRQYFHDLGSVGASGHPLVGVALSWTADMTLVLEQD
jgi:hypothetical protein